MYSWEVEEFLRKRNHYIGGDDLMKVTSILNNPQLNHIKFNAETSEYEMWDKEGNYFNFKAMPYTEAVNKGLVKQKDDDWER